MMWDSLNPLSLEVNTQVYVGASESEVLRMVRQGLVTGYSAKGIQVVNSDGIIREYFNWMEKL
jgi:hypothetical protein